MFKLKWLIVDKISLVTKWKSPAVKKAENKFAVFKIFKKNKLSQKAKDELAEVKKMYQRPWDKG